MRWLSIFKDPKIWGAILLAVVIRVGWSIYFTSLVDEELAAYEAHLETLTPEERMRTELRTADKLGRELLGVDLQAEELGEDLEQMMEIQRELDPVAANELDRALQEVATRRPRPAPVKIDEIPVIRYEAPQRQDLPAWAVAAALGAMFMLVGAAGSWYVLRMNPDDEDQSG